MNIARRRFLRLAAGATTLPAVSRIARAQAYPSRPVRLIVGFPAGAGADIVARILGRWLSERLGQEFIIENKPGANTSIAAQTALNAPPDGYALLWCGNIRSGALRPLAVTTAARVAALPDVPTLAETLADYEVVAWTGIAAPKGTPPGIVETLNREINSGLTNPDIKARLTDLTIIPWS